MSDESHVFHLMIYGETYSLRSADPADHVHRVAQYVDGKFYDLAKGSPSLPAGKMAVLASLNIADELLRQEARRHEAEERLDARVAQLVALLEDGLAGGPPVAPQLRQAGGTARVG